MQQCSSAYYILTRGMPHDESQPHPSIDVEPNSYSLNLSHPFSDLQWCFMLWPAAWFDVSPQRFEILRDRILSLLLRSLPVCALFPFPSFTSRWIVPSVPSLRVTSPGSPLERLLGLLSIPGRLYSSWRHQWPGLASCGRHLSGHLRHPNSREWMGPAWSGLNIQVLNQASLMFWFDLSPSSSLFLKRLLPCYNATSLVYPCSWAAPLLTLSLTRL